MDQIQLKYTITQGLNFNDTAEFKDEPSAWSYAAEIVKHVDSTIDDTRNIFKRNHVKITDSPYNAQPHLPFGSSRNQSEIETESTLARKNTAAIVSAIRDVSSRGGGTVIVPSMNGEVFYTAALRLESNVNLEIEEGAVLKFASDTRLYVGDLMKSLYGQNGGTDEDGLTLTRFESVELMNYSPFIYAKDCKNIALTGRGTLDGQCSVGSWHRWNERIDKNVVGIEKDKLDLFRSIQEPSRLRLFKEGQLGVPVRERKYGEASGSELSFCDDGFLRPNFIQFYGCQNILIEGITIVDSPMWEINPVLCDTVLVQNIVVNSHLSNNDGCDPESSSNVVIRGCKFDVGDDCIAIKSGRNADGLRVNHPSFNIVIENNIFADGHGGITIGSEVTGGVKNVFSRSNEMDSSHLQSVYRIKTNYIRGGLIENLYYMNDTVKIIQNNRSVFTVDMNYNIKNEVKMMNKMEIDYDAFIPIFKRVVIGNLRVNEEDLADHGGKTAFQIIGFDVDEISKECRVNSSTKSCRISDIFVRDSVIIGSKQGFNMKNVDNFKLKNVVIKGTTEKDDVINCTNILFSNCDFRKSLIKRSSFPESSLSFDNTYFD